MFVTIAGSVLPLVASILCYESLLSILYIYYELRIVYVAIYTAKRQDKKGVYCMVCGLMKGTACAQLTVPHLDMAQVMILA